MRLLPTDIDIAKLYCFIDPETRFLLATQEAINELMKDSMSYFDEIKDDIISVRRDVNGKRAPWYLSDYSRRTDSVRYQGKSFEYILSEMKFPDGSGVEHASCWDEI